MMDLQRVWKEFDANEVSHSVAHYLLAIARQTEDEIAPRAADIARALDISRAAVSLQLRALRENNLVEVGKNHRISLTSEGLELVSRILTKRKIIISFLMEILGVDPENAEEDACKIEHLISGETGAAMARFIRFSRLKAKTMTPLIEEFLNITRDCSPDLNCDFCTRDCILR